MMNKGDRDFINGLNSSIDQDLSEVDQLNPEERFTVFRDAFNKIIDHTIVYKPLLTAINAEYLKCIDCIRRSRNDAVFLDGKLQSIMHEPNTWRNYKTRAEELQNKIEIIRADNERLRKRIDGVRERKMLEERALRSAEALASKQASEAAREKRPIPGLTAEESTDVRVLRRELKNLEGRLKELGVTHRTRYAPRTVQERLKDSLFEKVALRDQLVDHTDELKGRLRRLKVASEAADAYTKIRPLDRTLGDVIIAALVRTSRESRPDIDEDYRRALSPGSVAPFDEDDPAREKEAELLLEYIDKFNELIENGQYEEAALHAANSPKDILRIQEIMNRFKELKGVMTSSGRSALLAFCDALMSTVSAYGGCPDQQMSYDCVIGALECNRLDLLTHWISQDRLTLSEPLGDLIYAHCRGKSSQTIQRCLALALKVYAEVECKSKAVVCLAKQGRLKQTVDYARNTRLQPRDYMNVLRACPLRELARAFYKGKDGSSWDFDKAKNKNLLPIGAVLATLLKTEGYEVGLEMIEDIRRLGQVDGVRDLDYSGDLDSSQPLTLRQAILDDDMTSREEWLEVIRKCQECAHDGAAIDILAAVTVQDAIAKERRNKEELETKERIVEEAKDGEQERRRRRRKEKEGKRRREGRKRQGGKPNREEDGKGVSGEADKEAEGGKKVGEEGEDNRQKADEELVEESKSFNVEDGKISYDGYE